MNILYIAHEMNLGGATRSLLALIDEMLIKNHNITVLVPGKQGELIEALKNRDVKVIKGRYYPWMSSSNSFIYKIKLTIKSLLNHLSMVKVAREIKNNNFEIIHTNSLVINVGGIIKNKIKEVIHVWHLREFGEEDHGLVFNFDNLKAMKYIENNSDAIIVISKALKNKYKNFFDERKLHLIYNGISLEYRQTKRFHRKDIINILISGGLNEGKGQEEAILAINELVRNGNKNIILNIAGRGNNQYLKKLEDIVVKYSLQNNIKFLGYIDSMYRLREKMDIELVCSRNEAFGRVTVEAMMSMNPVIATNTGANPELIRHGENGLLYQQGDYFDLADKLKCLINNNDLIGIYGRNGQKYASENFTAKSNADNIEDLYLELIDNNGYKHR